MATKPDESRSTPLIPQARVLVAILNDIEYDLACAEEFGLGAEVQVFGMPPYLGKDCTNEIERMAERLEGLAGPVGVHGPFMDLAHFSPDPAIREVCRKRYLEAFDLADALNAEYVIFHTQYNTMLRLPDYPEMFHQQSMEFWPQIVAEAERRGITICMENMFDEDPLPSRRLADEIASRRFKLCLDIAHAVIYSDINIANWIDAFQPHLRHVHINDCDGINDLHLALGKGTLKLGRAISLLEATDLDLNYTLETNRGGRDSALYLGYEPVSE